MWRLWTGWRDSSSSLAQFTCFTSAKVQILTPEELCAVRRCEAVDGLELLLRLSRVPDSKLAVYNAGAQNPCFTSTGALVYLLY